MFPEFDFCSSTVHNYEFANENLSIYVAILDTVYYKAWKGKGATNHIQIKQSYQLACLSLRIK